MVFQWRL